MGMGAADFGGAFAAAAALMQRATALAHSAHHLEGSQKTDAQQPASLAFQTFGKRYVTLPWLQVGTDLLYSISSESGSAGRFPAAAAAGCGQ
eukprot:5097169-Prorocentrum_lima.AAC.1